MDGRAYYQAPEITDSSWIDREAALFSPNLNPIFIQVLEPFRSLFSLGNVAGAGFGLLFGMISLTMRYRAAHARVRQQMKWLLWGLLPFVLLPIPRVILLQVPPLRVLDRRAR